MSKKEKGKEAAPATPPSIQVRVNPKRSARGAAYYDPGQRATIGAEPVTVERTPFVARLLLSGELVEA